MGNCVSFTNTENTELTQEMYTAHTEIIYKEETEHIKDRESEKSLDLPLPPQSERCSMRSWKNLNSEL